MEPKNQKLSLHFCVPLQFQKPDCDDAEGLAFCRAGSRVGEGHGAVFGGNPFRNGLGCDEGGLSLDVLWHDRGGSAFPRPAMYAGPFSDRPHRQRRARLQKAAGRGIHFLFLYSAFEPPGTEAGIPQRSALPVETIWGKRSKPCGKFE